jgi:ATP synthase protein I
VIPPPDTKPIRNVLKWQLIATAVVALLAGLWAGGHGMLSAVLGGGVNIAANALYALAYAKLRPASAGGVVIAAVRAEASKIGLIIALLAVVLAVYRDIVVAPFIAAFLVTALLFRIVLFVRD